eukprot:9480772-Pyramimonas_sp.AAC.1
MTLAETARNQGQKVACFWTKEEVVPGDGVGARFHRTFGDYVRECGGPDKCSSRRFTAKGASFGDLAKAIVEWSSAVPDNVPRRLWAQSSVRGARQDVIAALAEFVLSAPGG